MFGRLKDWRRVATRYDRCVTTFLSPVARAATVSFWLSWTPQSEAARENRCNPWDFMLGFFH